MQTTEGREKRTHHGHSTARLRRSQDMKQSTLAELLGVTQQTVSGYEKMEVIGDELLDRIAAALNVTPELIKNLEEEPLTIIFENNTQEIENNNGNGFVGIDNSTKNYNPVERIVELCEKLLESEKEKIALLEKLLKEKK